MDFYAPIWVTGFCVYFTVSPNHNIHGKNGVYQRWTTYALNSKSVLEMHIPMIWRFKFTDLLNSKKNSNWGDTQAKTMFVQP